MCMWHERLRPSGPFFWPFLPELGTVGESTCIGWSWSEGAAEAGGLAADEVGRSAGVSARDVAAEDEAEGSRTKMGVPVVVLGAGSNDCASNVGKWTGSGGGRVRCGGVSSRVSRARGGQGET